MYAGNCTEVLLQQTGSGLGKFAFYNKLLKVIEIQQRLLQLTIAQRSSIMIDKSFAVMFDRA